MKNNTLSLPEGRKDKFESSSPHNIAPCKSGRLSFINIYTVQMASNGKYTKWLPPKITYGKHEWYVWYKYKIPEQLRFKYRNRTWERFRVYEDINRVRTKEYAEILRECVEEGLKLGYNPFEQEQLSHKEQLAGITPKKEWTILQALLHFKQKWAERGLEKESLQKYYYAVDRFIFWLNEMGFPHLPADQITEAHLMANLSYYKKGANGTKWNNRTYNNEITFLSTAFNFMRKRMKIIQNNPLESIDKLKSKSRKHKYYDNKLLPKVKDAMLRFDPWLSFAAECVYGLCIRSEKEIMRFRVGDIYPDRKQVLIRAEDSKTDSDRYIPMTDAMVVEFDKRGILDMPGNWFVFGRGGRPGPERCGKRWFATKFGELRKEIGMPSEYTLYGFKHTRVIHMKKDGAKDDEIMAVTGHTDFVSYSTYLRDLGVDVDIEAIQKKSRKW